MSMFAIITPEPAPQPVRDYAAEVLHWSRHVSAFTLAEDISRAIDMPVGLVLDALGTVPENMATLLDSPQGWSALAGYVACELGCCPPDYMPGVH